MKRQLAVLVMAVVAAVMTLAATAQAAPLHGHALANRLSGVHHSGASVGFAAAAVAVALAVVVCAAVYAGVADRRRSQRRDGLARLPRTNAGAARKDQAA